MTTIASQSWGNAEIKFLPGQFSKKAVEEAAKEVIPEFLAPEDTFVMVDMEGHHTIAQVPSGPDPAIFGADGTDKNALIEALSQARDFLKNLYPPKKLHTSHIMAAPSRDTPSEHTPLLKQLAGLFHH